jgi:hypothetical protein
MRYADGPTVEVSLVIDAPVERVWELVSDINLPARFSSELQETRWVEGTDAPAVGARFIGRNRHAAVGEWETTSTVTHWEPLRSFGWLVGDPADPASRWRFDLSEEGGQVRLRQWAQIGPGWSGLSIAIEANPDKEERIVARRLEEHRANMLANLEGVKQLAEAGS